MPFNYLDAISSMNIIDSDGQARLNASDSYVTIMDTNAKDYFIFLQGLDPMTAEMENVCFVILKTSGDDVIGMQIKSTDIFQFGIKFNEARKRSISSPLPDVLHNDFVACPLQEKK